MLPVPGLSYQSEEDLVSQDFAGNHGLKGRLFYHVDIQGRGTTPDGRQAFCDAIASAFEELAKASEGAGCSTQVKVFCGWGVRGRDGKAALPCGDIWTAHLLVGDDSEEGVVLPFVRPGSLDVGNG